jgi:microcystin degradation protein MlrC
MIQRDPPDWCRRGDLRDELLNGEIFCTLQDAQIIVESWCRHYNAIRAYASLGHKPPAPEVFIVKFSAWPAPLRRLTPPATPARLSALN